MPTLGEVGTYMKATQVINPVSYAITLDSEELEFTKRKFVPENQLAFAVMLKFFQAEGRFPIGDKEISKDIIKSIANQLGFNDTQCSIFNLSDRTTKRIRQEIRKLLELSEPTIADVDRLKYWMMKEVLPSSPTFTQCQYYARQFFKKYRLKSFTQKQVDRHIRSAMSNFEKQYYSSIVEKLDNKTKSIMDDLLQDVPENLPKVGLSPSKICLRELKRDIAGSKLNQVQFEIEKLNCIRSIKLPNQLFCKVSRKLVLKYYTRIMASSPSNILELIPDVRYGAMASFCYIRSQKITDDLVDLFIKLLRRMRSSAQANVKKNIIGEVTRVNGKFDILYTLAMASKNNPKGIIENIIYPEVSPSVLHEIIDDLDHRGKWYQEKVNSKVCSLYSHAYRKVLLDLLDAFSLRVSHRDESKLLQAIKFIKINRNAKGNYYPTITPIPTKGIIPAEWQSMVLEDKNGERINRQYYEIAILETLSKKLSCKSLWIEGAYRYRSPEEDLPDNWEANRTKYYEQLGLPQNPAEFIESLKNGLHQGGVVAQ